MNMKKNAINKLFVMLSMVGAVSLFGGCKEVANMDNGFMLTDVVISGPGVNNHEVLLEMESTLQLSARETFQGMSDMVWKSYDESVATVDPKSGLVTPVAPGTVKITAYTNTKDVANGDYIIVTVAGKSLAVIGDALDQSLAD